MAQNVSPQPDQSDVDLMQAFVEAHGEPPAGDPQEPRSKAKATEPSDVGGDDDDSLDAATLKALGLGGDEAADASPDEDETGTPREAGDLASLAKALGLTADDFALGEGGVRVKTKVDGQEHEVSLEELRKGYQLQSHFTRQQEAFLAERKAWEANRQQQDQTLQAREAAALEVLQGEEQALNQRFTRNDWDTLRRDDPAEYAALVAEYNQKLQAIRGKQQQVNLSLQHRQQESIEALRQRSQQEAALLTEKLGWKDAQSVSKGSQALREYLIRDLGFTERDVDTTVDHRSFVLADKARRYDELMRKVDLARKKVSKAPHVPAGNGSRPEATGSRKLKDAQLKLAQTHSTEAAAEVFRHLKVI